MALAPRLSGCFRDNCKTLRLNDITGAYSATNLGGWGAPNTTLALADPVVITVTYPDESEEEYDVTDTVNAATISGGEFPLIDIDIEDTDLDLTRFADGVYTIEYSVTDSDTATEYTYTIKVWNDCKVACCVTKMQTKFCEKICGCDWQNYWMQYNQAEAMLFAAKCQFGKGDYDAAEDLLEQIDKICNAVNCNC